MSGSTIAEVESALAASRAGAERRLVESLRQAQRLEADAAAKALEISRRRIAELTAVRDAIAAQSAAIEVAATRLATTMAATSERLVDLTAEGRVTPSPWQSAPDQTVDRNLERGA